MYKDILKSVVAQYNTTPEEVDAEIRAAIREAGLNVPPEIFIGMTALKAKIEMDKQNGKD